MSGNNQVEKGTERQALDVLRQTFGYESFRPHQEQIVQAALAGRDVLAVMPTSAGKSICYQVPALVLAQRAGGLTVVVSPLISLMKDQVGSLRQYGVAASCLNSTLGPSEQADVLHGVASGAVTLLYVAPERLDDPRFLEVAGSRGVALLAVDEAHCISQWGNDFRPSYQRILGFIDGLPARPAVMALTATATRAVREDIASSLGLADPFTVVASFDRPNLSFAVEHAQGRAQKDRALLSFVRQRPERSGIVYCASRRAVEETCDLLRDAGLPAARYHAGLAAEERQRNQDDFLYDRASVMVATNAFGMGIDKSNVRFVLHYNMPKNMESYYQEAGRAGRDGAKADCILFYSGQDVITNQFFIEQDRDNEELTGEALEEGRRQDRERLKKMNFYCHTTDCLRDYILRYFGEFGSNYCGNCSNCLNTFETIDITELANDLIGCILTSGMRFGVNVILDTLRGSKNEKVLRFGLDSNRYYATHAQDTIVFLRQVLNYLVLTDYLVVTDDQFPIVKVKEKGLSFYAESGEFRPVLTMKAARKTTQTPAKAGQLPGTDKSGRKRSSLHTGSDPFEALRRLRTEIARAQHIPPYLVFSDKSLESMCVLLPQTKTEMLAVHGVGELKYQKYGEQFLALCQKLAGESEEF